MAKQEFFTMFLERIDADSLKSSDGIAISGLSATVPFSLFIGAGFTILVYDGVRYSGDDHGGVCFLRDELIRRLEAAGLERMTMRCADLDAESES